MNANVCIGIRIDGDQLQLAARQQGRALGQVSFSRDSVGRRALASYLAAWEAPLRLGYNWSDNVRGEHPVAWWTDGDAAPNGRAAYRYTSGE